jgi:translation elongation factor P/translation initiation factor 5A
MQVVSVRSLKKYDIFEHGFQLYFLLKKSVISPRKAEKKVVLIGQNISQKADAEKLTFEFEDFIKITKPQRQVVSFFKYSNDELVFFNKSNLSYINVKKQDFLYIMPFLVDDIAYEVFIYKEKILYIKPLTAFIKLKVSKITENYLVHNNTSKINIEKGGVQTIDDKTNFVLIDTRKFIY